MVIFLEKPTKAYFKGVILSLQNLWKHTKIQFPVPPIRYIDCLGKFFEAVIYRHKNNEGILNFQTTFESTLLSVNSLDAKRWKTGYIHANLVVMGK